jgi:uncharacterized protein (TIGR03086 family)
VTVDHTHLERAVEGLARRWYEVEPTSWGLPTPCADWDVRTLLNHVTAELLWMPPLLEGQTIADVGDRFDGDVLGADPKQAASVGARAAVLAAGQPGALERTVHLSAGDVPGGEYLGQVTSDVVIHTWDLARAVGADERLDEELVAEVDAFLGPQVEAWRSAGAFGPPAEVPEGAGLQARLLAKTGRAT